MDLALPRFEKPLRLGQLADIFEKQQQKMFDIESCVMACSGRESAVRT